MGKTGPTGRSAFPFAAPTTGDYDMPRSWVDAERSHPPGGRILRTVKEGVAAMSWFPLLRRGAVRHVAVVGLAVVLALPALGHGRSVEAAGAFVQQVSGHQ